MRIEVRLIEPVPGVGAPQLHQLPHVSLDVSSTTSVEHLISEATQYLHKSGTLRCSDIGVEKLIEQVGEIVFARSELNLVTFCEDAAQELLGVGENGEVIAPDETFSNVTIGDLLRAHREGLLRGNPSEPILVCSGSRRASLAESWEFFLAALAIAKFAADAVQAAGDAQGLGQAISRRAARRWARHFVEQGLLPRQLVRLIRKRKYWDTVRLAKYLGISAEEATSILRAAGYQFASGTQEWVRQLADDEESQLEAAVRRGEESSVTGLPPKLRRARRGDLRRVERARSSTD